MKNKVAPFQTDLNTTYDSILPPNTNIAGVNEIPSHPYAKIGTNEPGDDQELLNQQYSKYNRIIKVVDNEGITHHFEILDANLEKHQDSTRFRCPYCGYIGYSEIERGRGVCSALSICFGFFCCGPFGCLMGCCCCKELYQTYHYCPSCKKLISEADGKCFP